jgi:hypothetical protein
MFGGTRATASGSPDHVRKQPRDFEMAAHDRVIDT